MNWNIISVPALLAIICFSSGCDTQHPAVSGKVTYNGEPLPNVRLVFSPGANKNGPSPYSTGVTDEAGNFSLETRNGSPGAAAGTHKVGFGWSDIRATALPRLKESLRDSRDDPAEQARLKVLINDLNKKLESRPKIKPGLETTFSVPAEGTDEATFELTDF